MIDYVVTQGKKSKNVIANGPKQAATNSKFRGWVQVCRTDGWILDEEKVGVIDFYNIATLGGLQEAIKDAVSIHGNGVRIKTDEYGVELYNGPASKNYYIEIRKETVVKKVAVARDGR